MHLEDIAAASPPSDTGRFEFLGPAGPVAQAWVLFLVMWFLGHWLFQRRIFFKW